MLRSRTLKIASVLTCGLCATGVAYAVPTITDWSHPLSPAGALAAAPAPPPPIRSKRDTHSSAAIAVLTLAPAPDPGALAGAPPPPSLSSQLSLWSTASDDVQRPTLFAGAPPLGAGLAPAGTPAIYRFPLKADALRGLPVFVSIDTTLAGFLLPAAAHSLPEPSLLALLGLGLLGLAAIRRSGPAR